MIEGQNPRQQISMPKEVTDVELLSMDIFGSFNQPSLHSSSYKEATMSIDNLVSEDFEAPDPAQDWFPLRGDSFK